MASFKDLKNDWSALCQECTECWSNSDLQLAAELGKTLLERNKELENIIKLHQSTIEEQAQEIEYMKKQTAALREVNDSRLKIYEQLEVSIQDLERANHRLVNENTSNKKLIKSQCLTIETLEARCDELQKGHDKLSAELEALIRQQTASQSTNVAPAETNTWKASDTHGGSIPESAAPSSPRPSESTSPVRRPSVSPSNEEEVTCLLRQLQEARSARAREQEKVTALGAQVTALLHENAVLEEQVVAWRTKAEDVKSLQEEISTLEEVRKGQLCGRCLRGMDSRVQDELSVMLDHEEFDDISMAESFVNENQRESDSLVQDENTKNSLPPDQDANPYRVLVEKYQALLEVQKHSARRKSSIPTACVSLQEELEMSGEFNNFHNPSSEPEGHQEKGKQKDGKKAFAGTPTDFSEAETSSSGFLDETSNKATQTDERPGSLLCSIADGDDCKFSIYDDNGPFASRFRQTPEYRKVLSEIFSMLKQAAKAKDEAETLPVVEESTANRDASEDDNQSVMSSSVVSSVVSEPMFTRRREDKDESRSESASKSRSAAANSRSQLDYVSVNVSVRKKSSSKKSSKKSPNVCEVVPTTNPKFVPPRQSNGSGRRRFRPFTEEGVWNETTQYVYSRRESGGGRRSNTFLNSSINSNCSTGSNCSRSSDNGIGDCSDFKPSSASQEVAKLRRLEMSYAQALLMPSKAKANRRC